jgi:hypothetical protein
MQCPSCNANLKEGSKFCEHCGTSRGQAHGRPDGSGGERPCSLRTAQQRDELAPPHSIRTRLSIVIAWDSAPQSSQLHDVGCGSRTVFETRIAPVRGRVS